MVEKFDLFLGIASRSLSARPPSIGGQIVGNVAGLLLIALGGATIVLATIRFRKTARDMDSKDACSSAGTRMDLWLAGLLLLLGALLFGYLMYTVLGRL